MVQYDDPVEEILSDGVRRGNAIWCRDLVLSRSDEGSSVFLGRKRSEFPHSPANPET